LLVPPVPRKAVSAADVRAAKIAEFKLQKTLSTRISEFESRLDEEDIRSWALASIELAVIKTRQNMQGIQDELDVIASRPPPSDAEPESKDPDRLDRIPASSLPRSGPLLSGEGKVLRPFVLTPKRDELAQGVFRPDHSLPTMSVDEYLTEEIRRGGIQLPQEESAQNNEDRMRSVLEEDEEDDRETEKKREWDEFVETHAKGSGNTGFRRG
jgi:immunoglobulin-binding protein 1